MSEKLCFKCRTFKGYVPRDEGAHTAQVTTCEGCGEIRAILPSRHWIKPKLIKNWDELAKVEDSNDYTLDITPEDGNGWIKEISTGTHVEYLSTHTFYRLHHEYSTKLLQGFGFNVVIDNWDKKAT